MSKENNLTDFLVDVADAIRAKKGTSELINPQDFSEEIRSIESGSTEVEEKDINFYDYDGTLLFSYTIPEAQALTELPTPKGHSGLIFDGWNWDYEEVIALDYPMDIGAMYRTDDGATRLYIKIPNRISMDVPLCFSQSVSNGVIIDWGDGSDKETIEGTGYLNISHRYNDIGEYCIMLSPTEGCSVALGATGSNTTCVLGRCYGGASPDGEYALMLEHAEIGDNITIDDYCFRGCAKMQSISLHSNIKWKWYCFDNARELRAIMLPHITLSSTMCRSLIANCYSLKVVSFASDMSAIPLGMLSSNFELKKLCIPNSVKKTEPSFIISYGINYLRMPKSLASMSSCSFGACIVDFSALNQIPTLSEKITPLMNNKQTVRFIVPDALYDEWIAATNWSAYADRIVKASEYQPNNE